MQGSLYNRTRTSSLLQVHITMVYHGRYSMYMYLQRAANHFIGGGGGDDDMLSRNKTYSFRNIVLLYRPYLLNKYLTFTYFQVKLITFKSKLENHLTSLEEIICELIVLLPSNYLFGFFNVPQTKSVFRNIS